MRFVLNGQPREFPQLPPPATLQDLIADLALKGDRVAVEHNGNIVPRAEWANTALADGDRLEIVHFVGGGAPEALSLGQSLDGPVLVFIRQPEPDLAP
jgi:thiamine biosynthesis protein ThiS